MSEQASRSQEKRLRAAYQRARVAAEFAKAKVDEALQAAYPPGAEVEWVRGGFRQRGVVVYHGRHDRLGVENSRTGRTVWITGYDIHKAET